MASANVGLQGSVQAFLLKPLVTQFSVLAVQTCCARLQVSRLLIQFTAPLGLPCLPLFSLPQGRGAARGEFLVTLRAPLVSLVQVSLPLVQLALPELALDLPPLALLVGGGAPRFHLVSSLLQFLRASFDLASHGTQFALALCSLRFPVQSILFDAKTFGRQVVLTMLGLHGALIEFSPDARLVRQALDVVGVPTLFLQPCLLLTRLQVSFTLLQGFRFEPRAATQLVQFRLPSGHFALPGQLLLVLIQSLPV